MPHIVIEAHDPYFPAIVTDEEGYPLTFDTKEEADNEASECQIGIVVNY